MARTTPPTATTTTTTMVTAVRNVGPHVPNGGTADTTRTFIFLVSSFILSVAALSVFLPMARQSAVQTSAQVNIQPIITVNVGKRMRTTSAAALFLLAGPGALGFAPVAPRTSAVRLHRASTESTVEVSAPSSAATRQSKMAEEAARMRQEAAEMEIALREEARAKGLPMELVNKLVPPPRVPTVPAVPAAGAAAVATELGSAAAPTEVAATTTSSSGALLRPEELRSKLGYLNAGDAVRMTSELDRLKMKGSLRVWNSKTLGAKPNFAVSNGQLTTKTKIDPIKLKLDDVGYDYQRVFVAALVIGSVLGLSSSAVGGEAGFLLGYLSALMPIALVGVGSVAPALIFDVLQRVTYATDEAARDRYAHMQAGKFLVGYALGLPVARFDAGAPASTAEFFQLRPTGKSEAEDRRMFSNKSFSQVDIGPASAMCLGGAVAECMIFGEASGKNPADVNTLNDIMSRVEPALTTEAAQNHVRWSALTAHGILAENKDAYLRLVQAFKAGLPLEECISALEGAAPSA
jgi:hypothetical protein